MNNYFQDALESFVQAVNAHGNLKAEIVTSVLIGDTHYVEMKYTVIRPLEIIKIDLEILK